MTERRRWWRPAPSVRTRTLATVLLMSGLALAAAGSTTGLILARQLEERVDADVAGEVDEFQALAQDAIAPASGTPARTVAEVLVYALSRDLPAEDETFLTLIDGVPSEIPASERFVALEDEPDVMAYLESRTAQSPTELVTLETSAGPVRLAAVQVSVAGLPETGTWVIANGLSEPRAELAQTLRTFALVAAGAWVVIGVVAWVLLGRLLRPLRLLHQTAQRISDRGLAERIEVQGTDDISDLARAFNAMLDRLQAAFDAQKVFLDDAGHELRTPVTIVRGHLEVLDPGDAEDVEQTRLLLLHEVDRMSRLVEDLILLAKADRVDLLRPGRVDVGELTASVLEKAVPLGDRDWQLDERTDVVVDGDEQRVMQAMVQLVDNALKFTRPGDVIAVGSAIGQDDTVHLWVRDTGVGIAQEDADRVFDRFSRARQGRGVEGSGLGLSIVSAIANAHGGRVLLSSVPGKGSTFTLELPLGHDPALHDDLPAAHSDEHPAADVDIRPPMHTRSTP